MKLKDIRKLISNKYLRLLKLKKKTIISALNINDITIQELETKVNNILISERDIDLYNDFTRNKISKKKIAIKYNLHISTVYRLKKNIDYKLYIINKTIFQGLYIKQNKIITR